MSATIDRVNDIVSLIGRIVSVLFIALMTGLVVYVIYEISHNTPFTERYELERTACYDLQADMHTTLTPEQVGLMVHGKGQTCRSLVSHDR